MLEKRNIIVDDLRVRATGKVQSADMACDRLFDFVWHTMCKHLAGLKELRVMHAVGSLPWLLNSVCFGLLTG